MDIASLMGIGQSSGVHAASRNVLLQKDEESSFDTMLSAAMDMLNETNDLQNDSQSAKIQFALGEADNPHDMQIAEEKALTAIQYTMAVRDKLLEAYKEIMNMQI